MATWTIRNANGSTSESTGTIVGRGNNKFGIKKTHKTCNRGMQFWGIDHIATGMLVYRSFRYRKIALIAAKMMASNEEFCKAVSSGEHMTIEEKRAAKDILVDILTQSAREVAK